MEGQISTEISTASDSTVIAKITIQQGDQAILGTAFHLVYDPKYLEYQSYSQGDFFEQNQQEPIYLVKGEQGTVYAGISLRRDQQLVKGDGNLVNLYFKPIKEGKTALTFEKTQVSTLENGHKKLLTSEWKTENFGINNVFQPDNSLTFVLLIVGAIAFAILAYTGVILLKRRQKVHPKDGSCAKTNNVL